MRSSQFVFSFLVLNEILSFVSGIKWLSIATLSSTGQGQGQGRGLMRKEEECDHLEGLVRKQKQLCKRNLEMMPAVRDGAIEAISECQYQFKDRRWNCNATGQGSKGHRTTTELFGKLGNSGTRETAYVHAITSAGVAYVVTKTCSAGLLERCGCDGSVSSSSSTATSAARSRTASSDFEWSGCSDNIAYGVAFSRAFVDSRERVKGKTAPRALMNLHNNEAGRKAIEELMWTQCKCHGVSGSCELKTCWRSMPQFRSVASTLRTRYDSAVEVTEIRHGTRRDLIPKNAAAAAGKQPGSRPARDTDLVYLEASPDFCEPDSRTGAPGTRGRLCRHASNSSLTDGCDVMCCGRGYVTRRVTVTERCHCKFHWCCYVKCQQCSVEVVDNVCR